MFAYSRTSIVGWQAWRSPEREHRGFEADADYAILHQEPCARARAAARSIGVVFAIFVMWAAVSQIDEVTRRRQGNSLAAGPGTAEPGWGVVSEIMVREGEIVQPEQMLLRIDQTRFVSSVIGKPRPVSRTGGQRA